MTISAYLHRRVRAGKTDRAFDGSRNLKFFVEIPCPTMMSQSRKHSERKRENDNACIYREEPKLHVVRSFQGVAYRDFTAASP